MSTPLVSHIILYLSNFVFVFLYNTQNSFYLHILSPLKQLLKKSIFPFLVGSVCLLIVLWTYIVGYMHAGINFLPPHFHANFALYVNGERVDFSGDEFMEDVAGCSLSWKMLAKDRVHLHENNQDVIHIHDDGVSWGHFFTNIWYVFWESFLSTNEEEIYVVNEERKLYFILNDEQIDNPFNELINSKDKLLIVYGNEEPVELQTLYETVSDNAGEYNDKYDPGSCGWTNENGVLVILRDRIHAIMWHEGH